MSEVRYYHGTKRDSRLAPFAHEDKYTFWVYPNGGQAPQNKWDTVIKAADYCNNHVDEGKAPAAPQLKQYVCLGHSKMEDMDVAKAEWKARGLKAEVEWAMAPFVNKKYYHGSSLPREFPDGDNVFYMCVTKSGWESFQPIGRWIINSNTNKVSAQEYCSNHTEVSLDKNRKDFPLGEHTTVRQFVCNGHDSCSSGVWGDHLSFPEIRLSSGNADCLYPRFTTIAQQFHELEKGLEKTSAETNDLQRETLELKLFMNKANGGLNVMKMNDKLTTQLAAENAELKSMMKDAIRRLDFLEQQLKKTTAEKGVSSIVMAAEPVISPMVDMPNTQVEEKQKTNDENKFAYIYVLPLLFALFFTLFTTKQAFPMLTPAHHPQIAHDID